MLSGTCPVERRFRRPPTPEESVTVEAFIFAAFFSKVEKEEKEFRKSPWASESFVSCEESVF